MPNSSSLDRFFKIGLGLVAWATFLWMLLQGAQYLVGIVILFGLSFIFTYILLAPVNLMEYFFSKSIKGTLGILKLKFLQDRMPSMLPRVIAILMVYMFFALTTLIVSVRFIPVAADQLQQFSTQLPRYVREVEDWVLNQPVTQNYFHEEVAALKSRGELSKPQVRRIEKETVAATAKPLAQLSPTEKEVIREKLFGTSHSLNRFVREYLGGAFSNLLTVISTTLTGFVYALTGLVLVFYFLLDGKDLKEGFVSMLPPEAQGTADYLLRSMHEAMFGFVKGQVILGVATGIYMIIVYTLFDVPYAFFLGAFFAIAEILPVVGTWLGFTPGILVLLFINPIKLLMVMGLVYVYQVIKDNLVAPRILGKVVGLHPVIVIVSLLVCAKVAGLVGVLFAIPLASMVNVLIRFYQKKEREYFVQ